MIVCRSAPICSTELCLKLPEEPSWAMESFKALLAGDTDEENQPDIVQLSGLVPPLQIDTAQCTMVIIMPRNKTAGGAVDHKEMVNDPLSKAKRIFDILSNDESCKTLEKLERIKSDTPMSMADYQARLHGTATLEW